MHAVDLLLAHQQGLATRAQLRAAGLTRRSLDAALADGRLVRLRRDLYRSGPAVPRGLHLLSGGQPDPGYVAEVRAALLAAGRGAAARRRTAAVLWRLDLAVEPSRVELAVPPGRSRLDLPGVDVQRSPADGVLVPVLAGSAPLLLVPPLEAVMACARELPTVEGVAVADSALRSGLVVAEELRLAAERGLVRPGGRRAHRVVRLADPRCGSVLESLLRLLLVEAGLPRPRTQHVVRRDDGTLLARVDFAWPELGLVVEADGRRWHDPQDARDRDRRRSNALAARGWTVLRFSWADVVHRPDEVVRVVATCLARLAA